MWNLKSIRQPLDIVHNGTWDVCYTQVPIGSTVNLEAEYATNQGSVEAILFSRRISGGMPKRIVGTEDRNESCVISTLGDIANWGLRYVPGFGGYNTRTAAIRYQNQYGVKIYADGVQINN